MDGVIIINKSEKCTSHDIVQKAKKILNEKVGHTGTLDPMATGVLPLLIGKGTLCSKYLINHDKVYDVQLTLGKKTETADSEGKVIDEKSIPEEIWHAKVIETILNKFIGKQKQMPPMYSAIKVKGKKLYEYARQGKTLQIEPRTIDIYDIKLLNIKKESNQIEFQVHCSKGTYIRSLCEDIAEKLGTVGYMSKLNRIKVGDFSIKQAITIEDMQKGEFSYMSIEELFKDKPQVSLNEKKIPLLLNGVKLTTKEQDGVYRIYSNNKFIGIGIIEKGLLKRDIITM